MAQTTSGFISSHNWKPRDRVGSMVAGVSRVSFCSAFWDTCLISSVHPNRNAESLPQVVRVTYCHLKERESVYFYLSIPSENIKVLCTHKVHAHPP